MGDSRNPRVSLLKKYDIPVENLSYEYVESCSNKKELERIIRILRSGEEGTYPDLLKVAEEKLKSIAPDSRVLRVETPILTKEFLTKEEWNAVESELLSWEEEMNVMDKSLDFEKGRIDTVGIKNLPEVRKVVEPQTRKKTDKSEKKTKVVIQSNNNKRIKSGDYAAWDKYDVDKELLKMDVEEERQQEENQKKKREIKKFEKEQKTEIADVDKENYSSMEQQVLAHQAKDRGNECYKSGDLESALKYYDISIKLHPTVNAYNNRAMTYLKLKNYEIAIKDCNTVLNMEKNNIKALHRRATAYQSMSCDKEVNNYDQLALQDLYEIVHLEPNNKAAQADLQKMKKKLNIEDTGKKFRMPIFEELVSKGISKEIEEKTSNHNITDNNNVSAEKLPLTYYGPSTSTFQCEPYSMVHLALAGSAIPGQVLCKCNSNRPRQNPLCQKCGEAMSTPKPSKSLASKSDTKLNIIKKNEMKKEQLRQQSTIVKGETGPPPDLPHDVLAKENKIGDNVNNNINNCNYNNNNNNNNTVKSNSLTEINRENHLQQVKSVELENKKVSNNSNISNDTNEVDFKNSKNNHTSGKSVEITKSSPALSGIDSKNSEGANNDKTIPNIVKTQVEKGNSESTSSEVDKHIESVCNKNIETSSSQGEVNQNVKKSKNKKKKSKDHKETKALKKHLEPLKMEPVKVVHAAKYLHPTSVEPKRKNETSADSQREPSFPTNIQYKAFVPNRKCYSTECRRVESSATTAPLPTSKKPYAEGDQSNNDLSFEGNKENISENNCSSNGENTGREEGGGEEGKREVMDSAFEFMKTWEELKKTDESYVKRAEIIRKIAPSDLGKGINKIVIGIKLDSDMLSCLLECLLQHFVENDTKRVVELLKQLPQVPRFRLVSMFLADSDRKKMKKLIDTAENKGFKLDDELKRNLIILS